MPKLLVVGAGAAGLFAAGIARRAGLDVTVVEHMEQPGRKLTITGKGRCNLTNNCDEAEFLKNVRSNPRFLYSALYGLPPAAVMAYFEGELHLPLKTERGRRVFPASDSAEDVVEALRRAAQGAEFLRGRATGLLRGEEGGAQGLALEDGRKLHADAVLLATGGVSYPVTGSTGLGHKIARGAGHTVTPLRPSLVAMVEKGGLAKRMQGLSLRHVNLRLLEDGKEVFSEQGEMLFTHFGLSGPLTLSASAFVENLQKHQYTAEIDLKPALSHEKLENRIQRDFDAFPARSVPSCLEKLLPSSLREPMAELWGVPPQKKAGEYTREERARLARLLKALPIPIASLGDLRHAVITRGGVAVKELNPKTMESRLCPGLFFAGEILDVDGYTGGYNLQIAWCTANAAVNGALLR